MQTSTSPAVLSQETAGLTTKSLVVCQDFEGRTDSQAGSSFTLAISVAKLVIQDVSNLRLTITRPVITTIEVHNARNLSLVLGDSASTERTAPICGTLTLDPHLDYVSVVYMHSQDVGAVIFTQPTPDALATTGRTARRVTVSIEGREEHTLADDNGPVQEQSASSLAGSQPGPGQSVLHYRNGWQYEGLQRMEKDYPAIPR